VIRTFTGGFLAPYSLSRRSKNSEVNHPLSSGLTSENKKDNIIIFQLKIHLALIALINYKYIDSQETNVALFESLFNLTLYEL